VTVVPSKRPAAAALIVVAVVLGACGASAPKPTHLLYVGNGQVRAEIADSARERSRGLAGRASLADGQGMLFVFGDRAVREFWMKGMRFPIDILWIDHGRVTGVERDAPVPAPATGLPRYRSAGPADRVLEVPAGWAARHGVGRGDLVVAG
jgi:uncharacterized protein